MNWTEFIGRSLGYENVTEIESYDTSFGASWANRYPALVLIGCLVCFVVALQFYRRYQPKGRTGVRIALGLMRGALLSMLLIILADPILQLTFTSHPRPLLWVMIDGTDSMNIEDEFSAEEREELITSLEITPETADPKAKLPRMQYVKALLQKPDDNLLEELNKRYRLKLYMFDGPDNVRAISLNEEDSDELDKDYVIQQLKTEGQVTAIGNAFEDLARRHASSNLSGMLVISDFAHNAGTAPDLAASKLNIPISTVGIGARTARDLAVDLQAPPKMKKNETSTIEVTLTQQELQARLVTVRVTARKLDQEPGLQTVLEIGEQEFTLEESVTTRTFPYTPEEAGRYEFQVQVGEKTDQLDDNGFPILKPLEGEVVDQNNKDQREVTIIDDFMRLLYVEYEPTWEWRFVKEVFYRDQLVGTRGFRTFLRSADPKVKENNELFLPSLTQSRKDFFQYDVIFLGDMPASTLSSRFCEMTKEFVSQFGGGLVVMAGPNFGPGELAETPLADMLPVIVDPDGRIRDEQEFSMMLTPMAAGYDFMNLGETPEENEQAWSNMSRMPWFQPVKRLEPSASTILAAHPTEKCADGKTPQPLIAIRKYGRGEVIYIASNEMWRLRRKYGEEYYRQFWGQMIHRLGLSHALGSQKRFVVRPDRQKYRSDEKVILTVEAYNEEFEPLTSEDLTEKTLKAELMRPRPTGETGTEFEELRIAELRPGIFEVKMPVFDGGEYRVRVFDPIAEDYADPVFFQVTQETVERRDGIRNAAVQQNIAHATQGKTYELTNVNQFLEDFQAPRLTEHSMEIFTLWDTWLTFGVFVVLALGEWFTRKMVNLA